MTDQTEPDEPLDVSQWVDVLDMSPWIPLMRTPINALIFQMTCRSCGTDINDARWSISLECQTCEWAERRRRHDELFRKTLAELVADAGLTIEYSRDITPYLDPRENPDA